MKLAVEPLLFVTIVLVSGLFVALMVLWRQISEQGYRVRDLRYKIKELEELVAAPPPPPPAPKPKPKQPPKPSQKQISTAVSDLRKISGELG